MLDVEEQLRKYGTAVEAALMQETQPAVVEPQALDVPSAKRSRGKRRRAIAIAVVCALLAIVSVLVMTLGQERSRPEVSARPQQRGTFNDNTKSVLVLSDGIDGVTAIDLDHRIVGRRVIQGERAGDAPAHITVTDDQMVVGWGEIYAYGLRTSKSRKLADATIYLPAAEPGQVWTVSWTGGQIGSGSSTIERITTDGTVTLSSTALDLSQLSPVTGVPGGLVVQTKAGQLELWDAATGTLGPELGPGLGPIASNGRTLAWCANSCSDVRTAPLSEVGEPTAAHADTLYGQQLALSDDGHWLAVVRPSAQGDELMVRDLANGRESIVATGLPDRGSLAWTADSHQLFYVQSTYPENKTRVGRYVPSTRRWELKQVPVGDMVGGPVMLTPAQGRSFFNATVVRPQQCPGASRTFPSGRHGTCSFRY